MYLRAVSITLWATFTGPPLTKESTLNTSHVVGGGAATLLGAVAVSLVNHFLHSDVSDADALVIGSAVVSAGVGLGHVIGSVGVAGLFSRFLHGAPKDSAPVVVASSVSAVVGPQAIPVLGPQNPPVA